MNSDIEDLRASEILDSRGSPTLSVSIRLVDGTTSSASVPSGTSTDRHEAFELLDGDKHRYFGKGVLKAVANVNGELRSLLTGSDAMSQRDLDNLMCKADGTPNKSRLGANAILGVSLAAARAAGISIKIPLYEHIARLAGNDNHKFVLPIPMMTVLSGGKHAENNLDFQEFMLFPIGAPTFREALRSGVEIFQILKSIFQVKGICAAIGDEGGFAPNLKSNEEAIDFLALAINHSGYELGECIAIALAPVASEFFDGNVYTFSKSNNAQRTPASMGEFYLNLVEKYPIASLEDAMAVNDREGWTILTRALGGKIQLAGSDMFVRNPNILFHDICKIVGNAVVVKLDQIGTISEALDCVATAKTAGYNVIVSHRSGETDDTFIADFAVGTGCGQIKAGSLCRSERIAKYNRLLEIERELGSRGGLPGK